MSILSRFSPIIALSLLVVLILSGYFLWWPKYQEFKEKKIELETKESVLSQKQEYLSRLKETSAKLAGYSEIVNKIDSALPTEPSIAALYNFILKATSENGLFLDKTDLGSLYALSIGEERIQKMSFTISVSGSYSALKNFLSAIFQNIRLIKVDSISFSFPTEEEKEFFTFDLALTTHAYSPTIPEKEPIFDEQAQQEEQIFEEF